MVLMWVSMTILGIQAVAGGDFRIILYPLDCDGNICGTTLQIGAVESVSRSALL